MPAPILVIGLGQLGVLFSEAFLRLGRTVVPVLRSQSVRAACEAHQPELILVAVGEDDLEDVLREIPTAQRANVVLLQNELRPEAWLTPLGARAPFRLPRRVATEGATEPDTDPSFVIVWFEKKAGAEVKEVRPSVIFGRHHAVLQAALGKLSLHSSVVKSPSELCHALALKNLYILSLNLLGMQVGGTASELLTLHSEKFEELTSELLLLEQTLLSQTPGAPYQSVRLDRARLKAELKEAILADPAHGSSGRTAPRRLARTLAHARHHGLQLPFLSSLEEAQKELP